MFLVDYEWRGNILELNLRVKMYMQKRKKKKKKILTVTKKITMGTRGKVEVGGRGGQKDEEMK